MRYHFKVHKEKDRYWAHSLEKGLSVNSQGDTLSGLLKNLKEALDLALNEPEHSKWLPPDPNPSLKGKNVYEISVDPKIALATQVRSRRLQQGWSQRVTATKLGIKHVSQYQKLESGATANMEFETLVKLKQIFPDFSVDEVLR